MPKLVQVSINIAANESGKKRKYQINIKDLPPISPKKPRYK
jgi:hypothetical protein